MAQGPTFGVSLYGLSLEDKDDQDQDGEPEMFLQKFQGEASDPGGVLKCGAPGR
jgi:hypothetical protein